MSTLIDIGVPPSVAQGLAVAYAAGIGSIAGGASGAAAGANEAYNNTAMASRLLTATIELGGVAMARACLASPTCVGIVGISALQAIIESAKFMNKTTLGDLNPNVFGGSDATSSTETYGMPPPGSNNTGNTSPPPVYGGSTTTSGTPIETNNNTGGTQTGNPSGNGTAVGGGYGASNQPVIDPIVLSVDPRLPIPKPTVGSNGIPIESNGKHTPGLPGYKPDAGTEPRNSLEIFDNSIPTKDPSVRLAVDQNGNVHRFFDDNNGSFHWSGSTADPRAPLSIDKLRQAGYAKELRDLGIR